MSGGGYGRPLAVLRVIVTFALGAAAACAGGYLALRHMPDVLAREHRQ
jgi:hypothetical protein